MKMKLSYTALASLGATLCVSACAPPEHTTLSQPLTTRGEPATTSTPDVTSPAKPATPLPVVEVLTPDAAALAAHPTMDAPDALPLAQRQRLAASTLPVLLPGSMTPAQLAAGVVTTGPHWYALSSTHDGVTLYLQGTRTTVEHGQVALDEAGDEIARQPYVISRTHQITTLSFERFGLGYHLDVECARPESDSRCTQDDYARSLHESMTLLTSSIQGGVQ